MSASKPRMGLRGMAGGGEGCMFVGELYKAHLVPAARLKPSFRILSLVSMLVLAASKHLRHFVIRSSQTHFAIPSPWAPGMKCGMTSTMNASRMSAPASISSTTSSTDVREHCATTSAGVASM